MELHPWPYLWEMVGKPISLSMPSFVDLEIEESVEKPWMRKARVIFQKSSRPVASFLCDGNNLMNIASSMYAFSVYLYLYTSSTARGGGGSFKKRESIGEIGCCESRMSEQKH